MATQDILLGGFGSTGSASLIVTRGFASGAVTPTPTPEPEAAATLYKRGRRGDTSAYWQDWRDEEDLLIMIAFLARNDLL